MLNDVLRFTYFQLQLKLILILINQHFQLTNSNSK